MQGRVGGELVYRGRLAPAVRARREQRRRTRELIRLNEELSETNRRLAELLDLVALGTVADVVPLDHNNRILVHQGLCRIRAGRCVPGIAALLELAGRDRGRITASDLGFVVGPRLNAAGRLQDMSLGIECLLADDPGRARRAPGTDRGELGGCRAPGLLPQGGVHPRRSHLPGAGSGPQPARGA